MVVKRITKERRAEAEAISAVCFNWPFNREQYDAEAFVKQAAENPKSVQEMYWDSVWACYNDSDQMMGCIGTYPYEIWFDGQKAKMSGIGGVCSLAAFRRQGVIRACFETAFQDMYQNGAVFSVLYPFNVAYYRRFGYQNFARIKEYEVRFADIPCGKSPGSLEEFTYGCDLSPYQKVYDEMAPAFNLAIARREIDWKRFALLDPAKDGVSGCLYRDENGRPAAYMFYKMGDIPGTNTRALIASAGWRPIEFVFTTPESLLALLRFAAGFSSYVDRVVFYAPSCFHLELLFNGAAQTKIDTNVMSRVVHVEKALRMARYQGTGSVLLSIHDPYIEQNDGIWRVCFQDGAAQTVERAGGNPDLSADIGDFSALITGTHSLDDLPFLQNTKIMGSKDALRRMFYRKKTWIGDYF